jgi:hypothetical protein
MVSRLFKLDNALARISVLGGALSIAACGGGTFSAGSGGGTGGSAGGTTNGGGSDSGGSAAAGAPAGGASGAPAGGASGGMSTAGTGGKPTTGCDCAAGSYCQDGANKCRLCSDFSRLQFAAPEELATLSQSATVRFPRAASAGTDLFYRSGADAATQIWYAATPVSGVGVALSDAGRIDSAPLLAPGVVQQNFFFDRLEVATNLRHIWVATWSGTQLSVAAMAPAPFNAASASDFSVAVAPAAGPDGAPKIARAYWMSTRAGGTTAALVWSNMVGVTPTMPAALDVQVQAGTKTCPLLADDATPWVNTAGTLLLFRSESVDDSCVSNDAGAFDLYAAPLSTDTGLTSAPAVALSALNNTGGMSTETDPSLSQDSCTIYFASDNGTKSLALYRAARN